MLFDPFGFRQMFLTACQDWADAANLAITEGLAEMDTEEDAEDEDA